MKFTVLSEFWDPVSSVTFSSEINRVFLKLRIGFIEIVVEIHHLSTGCFSIIYQIISARVRPPDSYGIIYK